MDAVSRLSKAFALSMPDEQALTIRDEVGFVQAIRASFAKNKVVDGRTGEDINSPIRQLVSVAVTTGDTINIVDAAGIRTPDISILSDDFLDHMRHLPQKNLALELLRKLVNDEIKSRGRKNAVQAGKFSAMREKSILRYKNRAIDAAIVISLLIDIAKEVREAKQQGEQLGLSEEEYTFYGALAESESAVDVIGDKQLAIIAVELVQSVRANMTIDWTVKQTARAKIRVLTKRILRRFGYPPDLQDTATETILEQAELLAAEWSAAQTF